MTRRKQRLTVTVDPDVVAAGTRAVAAGRAGSLSGWVNAALSEKADRDRRMHSLAAAVARYERDVGEITEEEIRKRQRADREAAVVVRGRASAKARPARPRKRTGVA